MLLSGARTVTVQRPSLRSGSDEIRAGANRSNAASTASASSTLVTSRPAADSARAKARPQKTGRSTFAPPAPAPATTSAGERLIARLQIGRRTPGARPITIWLSLAAAVLSAAAVGLRELFAARSVPAPATPSEAVLTADAYALTSGGAHLDSLSLSQAITSRLLAVYNTLTGAPGRYDSLSDATREFFVVVTVLGALATYALCRRLSLGIVASAAAVLISGLPLLAASTRLVAWSAAIASTLVITATLFGVRAFAERGWRWFNIAAGAVFAVAAILVSPAAALIPVGGALALAVTVDRGRWRSADRTLAAAIVVVALAGTVWLSIIAPPGTGPIDIGLRAFSVGVALTGILVGALASSARWLLPVVLAAAPIIVAPLWPGPVQASAAILALVPIAILAAAYAEHLASEAETKRVRDVLVSVTAVAAAALLALLPAPSVTAAEPPDAPYDQLAAWVTTEIRDTTPIEVSPLFRAELLRRGVKDTQLVTEEVKAPDVVTVAIHPLNERTDLPLLASFGEGASAVGIRLVLADPGEYVKAQAAERSARLTYGVRVTANPNLVLTESARADILSGNVDSRLLVMLSQAAVQMRLTVVAFPSTDGNVPAATPRRVATVTDVTNIPAGSPVGGATPRILQLFNAQQPPYVPLDISAKGTTVTIRYSAPSPVGIIP